MSAAPSSDPPSDSALCASGVAVIETEARALSALTGRVDGRFAAACRLMLACRGRVVVTGMGKSGHVARKIAATLASAGTPAFFVHPGEASHGDVGMITATDMVVALSNSGETDEILTILPIIKRLGIPLVTLTGNDNSRLAGEADVHIDVSVEQEACPLGLAPTASTTAALAMGDALAIALLEAPGVQRRGLRPLASGRAARTPATAPYRRRDAYRRRRAASADRRDGIARAGGNDPFADGHDRGGRCRRSRESGYSPTAICGVPSRATST